jgi:trimethylamine--corrinoid protein Co-methyltransferase
MRLKLDVLNEEQIEKIYAAALEVMERTGSILEDGHSVELLQKAGARLEGSNRVYIAPELVEQAIESAPATVTMYDRLGNVAMELGTRKSYFGAHVNCRQVIDPHTGKTRDMTLDDLEKTTWVVDALPNMDFITLVDTIAGVRGEYADVAVFSVAIKNTSKPFGFDLLSLETGKMICEIAAAAVGGPDELRRRPFICIGDSSIAPLFHPAEPLEKIVFAAEQGIPVLYNPMPQGGLTAPTTMAGVLVVTLAELLVGLVITQLVNPGSPFICGGVPSIFDMRDTSFVYGSPELFLMASGLADIQHHLNLPSFGTAGMTNSKHVDLQAATDASLSVLMSVLSGCNWVHDVGLVDIGVVNSLPMIVLTDEIVEMARHIEKGIEVTSETLALDVIDRVGPQGNYMAEEHTLEYFRDCWYPRIFDHKAGREGSSKDQVYDRIQQSIDKITKEHEPAELPAEALQLIESFSETWMLTE